MVVGDCERDGFGEIRCHRHGYVFVGLIDKLDQARDACLYNVPAIQIRFAPKPDRIGHIAGGSFRSLVKFPKQKHFLSSLREITLHRLQVPTSHGENEGGFIYQLIVERTRPVMRDIDAQLPQGDDGIGTWRLTRRGSHTGRHDTYVIASLESVPEQPFGHRAATDVSSANE